MIAGGGLAGIAAAAQLAQFGCGVTLLEARHNLGGRATSYVDAETGNTIDNCQHVSMGCCTNLSHLCSSLGIDHWIKTRRELFFISPRGECTRFAADPLPAPLHLTRAFWKLPYLTVMEKIGFARGVSKLAAAKPEIMRGQNFLTWLKQNGQTDNLIRNVWEVVLVSALSESLERIDAAYAQKVFRDGFLLNRRGWQVEVPNVSLNALYSQGALDALQKLGVTVQRQSRVQEIVQAGEQVSSVKTQDGRELMADEFVLAIPHHQLDGLLEQHPQLQHLKDRIARIETAPITSVHLWFDREITTLPDAVFVDRLSQWVFARGASTINGKTGFLYQVVISASRQLANQQQSTVIANVVAELAAVWPEARAAQLLYQRMITERRAVFSVTPGIDDLRPQQQSPIVNLQLAGDWTQTGWPSTMEGAVRSGYLAAANIINRNRLMRDDLPAPGPQPDLPTDWLARWIWGRAVKAG